jgi:integrase
MASLSKTNGAWRILFYDRDKTRRTIFLGRIFEDDEVEAVFSRVKSLINAQILGQPIENKDATWLAGKGSIIRPKLEAAGLVPKYIQPKQQTVEAFLECYIERYGGTKKKSTIQNWQKAIKNLVDYLPKGIQVSEVTVGHVKEFIEKLRPLYAKSTLHRRVTTASQFFKDAVDWEMIQKNPFAKHNPKRPSGESPNEYVDKSVIYKMFEFANPTWKAILALSRFGGLRCPSETLSLKWQDIDFETSMMAVPQPKLEHIDGRAVRTCPLFPDLADVLSELFNATTEQIGKPPSLDSYVIDKPEYRAAAARNGWKNANLRTQCHKLREKAGIPKWDRLFHSLRASLETDLEKEHSLHVVCAWLGNNKKVARESYLLVTDADYERALTRKPSAPNRAHLPHPAHENDTANACKGKQTNTESPRKSQGKRGFKSENREEISGHSGSRINSENQSGHLEITRENDRCNNSLKNRAPNRARAAVSSENRQTSDGDARERILSTWQNMQADAETLLYDAGKIANLLGNDHLPSVKSAWEVLQKNVESLIAQIACTPASTSNTQSH